MVRGLARKGLTEASHVSKLPTTGFPGVKELECVRGCGSEEYSGLNYARNHDLVP